MAVPETVGYATAAGRVAASIPDYVKFWKSQDSLAAALEDPNPDTITAMVNDYDDRDALREDLEIIDEFLHWAPRYQEEIGDIASDAYELRQDAANRQIDRWTDRAAYLRDTLQREEDTAHLDELDAETTAVPYEASAPTYVVVTPGEVEPQAGLDLADAGSARYEAV